jgi:hypothetical protein
MASFKSALRKRPSKDRNGGLTTRRVISHTIDALADGDRAKPVSYTLTGKRGNRAQFANMVTTCHQAGVCIRRHRRGERLTNVRFRRQGDSR